MTRKNDNATETEQVIWTGEISELKKGKIDAGITLFDY